MEERRAAAAAPRISPSAAVLTRARLLAFLAGLHQRTGAASPVLAFLDAALSRRIGAIVREAEIACRLATMAPDGAVEIKELRGPALVTVGRCAAPELGARPGYVLTRNSVLWRLKSGGSCYCAYEDDGKMKYRDPPSGYVSLVSVKPPRFKTALAAGGRDVVLDNGGRVLIYHRCDQREEKRVLDLGGMCVYICKIDATRVAITTIDDRFIVLDARTGEFADITKTAEACSLFSLEQSVSWTFGMCIVQEEVNRLSFTSFTSLGVEPRDVLKYRVDLETLGCYYVMSTRCGMLIALKKTGGIAAFAPVVRCTTPEIARLGDAGAIAIAAEGGGGGVEMVLHRKDIAVDDATTEVVWDADIFPDTHAVTLQDRCTGADAERMLFIRRDGDGAVCVAEMTAATPGRRRHLVCKGLSKRMHKARFCIYIADEIHRHGSWGIVDTITGSIDYYDDRSVAVVYPISEDQK